MLSVLAVTACYESFYRGAIVPATHPLVHCQLDPEQIVAVRAELRLQHGAAVVRSQLWHQRRVLGAHSPGSNFDSVCLDACSVLADQSGPAENALGILLR